jgi:hypothetical protein
MKNKKDHHYTMLIGIFVLVVLAAAIIFMTQFNAQVGEAGRMINLDNTKIDNINEIRIDGEVQPKIQPKPIIINDIYPTPKPGYSGWDDAWKRGILVDPGYGDDLPGLFEAFDNIIIINTDEEEPKLVLYDPRWHDDIVDLFKPRPAQPSEPKPPVPPSLEELGRIRNIGSWTCYYDENGNFVRAWRMSRSGNNVEINEDPDGRHNCPKTVEVKKIEPALPPPIVGADEAGNKAE